MNTTLDKVDFDKYTVYDIQIKIAASYMFEGLTEDDTTTDEHGQAQDIFSDVRRTIKYSSPFDNKKIISTINIDKEKEDEHGTLCRDFLLKYHLLVETEEVEDFSVEELHDNLEEEWRDGSSDCEITINLKDSNT